MNRQEDRLASALDQNELQTSLAEALNRSNILIRRFDGTIEYWTRGCERLYGWTEEEALGRKSHDLLKTKFSTLSKRFTKIC